MAMSVVRPRSQVDWSSSIQPANAPSMALEAG
jgi:hypothetical protein